MLKKIVLTILIFASFSTYSQLYTVKGVVNNEKEAIPFAKVWFSNTSYYAISKTDGSFEIKDIPKGNYTLEITSSNHKKYSDSLKIEGDINLGTVNVESIDLQLDEIVVTGTMKEVSISRSPVKIELITKEFFKSNPVNNVIEALETVNGVQEQVNCGVCGTNDIHINGMEGPYTLVLIDGMPIVSGLASVYGFNGIPTSLIDRVEIIKGPSSTLYGTEAVGGVINIITKSPGEKTGFELDIRGSSHEQFNGALAFSPKLNKKVSTMLGGDFYYNQKMFDDNNDNFTDFTLNNRISAFNKWQFRNSKDQEVANVAVRYYNEKRFGGTLQWEDAFLGSDSIYGEHIKTERVEFIGNYFFPTKNRNLKLSFSANSHNQDSYYGDVNYKADQQVFFTNLLWNKTIGKRNDIMMGYTNNIQFYKDNSSSQVEEKTFVPGVFIQDEFSWTEELTLLGGARLDYHLNHGLIFSPRLSLKKDFGSYTTFRFNYGNGFRQVRLFTEDHAFLTGARDIVIKDELKPERSHNVTLNFNHTYSVLGYGNFDVDAFYTYFLNKITPDYNTDPDLIIYDNLNGYGITRGVSFAVNHKFKIPLRARLGVTLQDVFLVESPEADVKEREEQLFAPFFSGVFNMSYNIKSLGLKVNYTGKVVGPQHLPVFDEPFSRPETSPWYTLQNVQLTKQFKKGIEVYGGIKNIFNYTQNTPLVDPGNPFGDNFDTSYAYGPVETRRYYIGFRYIF